MQQKTQKNMRIPPQHLESEMALLGGILRSADAIYEVTDIVTMDTFYADKHKAIYETMLELNARGEPIDIVTMSGKLADKSLLEKIGGRTYLGELISSIPPASNIRHYAELVKKKHTLRRLISSAEHISELGYDENRDTDELLDIAEKEIFDISNSSNVARFIPVGATLDEAWDRLERLHQSKDELRGVPTGFKDLDAMLSGFQKSDLIILAARPSMGKTALALDIARQAALNHGISVGIFSLEMSSQQLVDRMLSADSQVNAWKLRTGKLSIEQDFEKLRHSIDRLSKAPIYIDDQPGNNILKMRSVARKLKIEKGLGMIVVDYLQLITPTGNGKSDNVVQQVTEISRALKQLARELEVPVLALSQLSRDVEKRGGSGRPKLSDLRDSGSIEQDADVVMFIHREDKYREDSDKQNIAQIHIDKHRNGPVGSIELYFDGEKTTFLSIDKNTVNNDGF
ncbi:MAG: replicative helicase, replicative helicase [Candidatus Taylorbacteria bacterium]|nr:replicative helicase, replicative helicase [Candidatus Taylorbacteria bacterium]